MSTLKDKTITSTYEQLIKRQDSYSVTGNQIEIMNADASSSLGTQLYLDAANSRVGIGAANPAELLHVQGSGAAVSLEIESTNHDAYLKLTSDTDEGQDSEILFQAGDNIRGRIEYDHHVTKNSQKLNINVGDDDTVMTMLGDGNIGIGTTAPSSLLHIQADSTATTAPTEVLRLEVIDAATDLGVGEGPAIDFYVAEENLTSDWGARIACVRQNATDTQADAGLSFWTGANDANPTEKMRITMAGDIGIGTTAPEGKLHIIHSSSNDDDPILYLESSQSDSNSAPDLKLYRNSPSPADNDTIGHLSFTGNNDAAGTAEEIRYGDIYCKIVDFTDGTETGAFMFRTRNNGTDVDTMWIGGNNVGIGTTNPSMDLTINKTNGGELLLETPHTTIEDGDDLGHIYFGGHDNTLGSPPAHGALIRAEASATWDNSNSYDAPAELQFFTNDRDVSAGLAQRMVINEYGNVGIGYGAPTIKLHVYRDSSDETSLLRLEEDGTGDSKMAFSLTGTRAWQIGIDNSDSDRFKIASQETNGWTDTCLTIKTGGNIGIGVDDSQAPLHIVSTDVSDSSPILRLECQEDGADTGPDLMLYRNSANPADNDNLGKIMWYGKDDGGVMKRYASIFGHIEDTTSPNEDGALYFQTSVNGSDNSTMYIGGSKVGIGTDSPGHKFHVSSAWTSGQFLAELTNTQSSNPNGLHINCSHGGGGYSLFCASSSSSAILVAENGGDIGIGTDDPDYRLDVRGGGNGNYVACFDNTGTASNAHGIVIRAGDTGHADSDTHYILFEEVDGDDVGELDSDGGNLALNDTSDYRLKENINLITGGLAKINALKPSTFNYKKYPNKVHEGFIAHEVAEAGIGYAVKGVKDALKDDGSVKPQLFAITNIIPQLVSAIQELSAKVTALENA